MVCCLRTSSASSRRTGPPPPPTSDPRRGTPRIQDRHHSVRPSGVGTDGTPHGNTFRAQSEPMPPPGSLLRGPFALPGCDLVLRFDGLRRRASDGHALSHHFAAREGGATNGWAQEGGGAGILVDGRPGLVHLVGGSGRRARPVGTSVRSHPKRWVQLTNGAAVVLGPPTGREPMKQAHHRTHNVNEHTTYHLPRTLVGQTTVRQLGGKMRDIRRKK